MGKTHQVDYDVMFRVFGFRKTGLCEPSSDFSVQNFWQELTGGVRYLGGHLSPNGLIVNHRYLIMHKFIAHVIFEKHESNKITHHELFIL